MTSQVQKNQKLLAELSSLGQIKRKYESSRTALILCVLVVVIVNYFLTLGEFSVLVDSFFALSH